MVKAGVRRLRNYTWEVEGSESESRDGNRLVGVLRLMAKCGKQRGRKMNRCCKGLSKPKLTAVAS